MRSTKPNACGAIRSGVSRSRRSTDWRSLLEMIPQALDDALKARTQFKWDFRRIQDFQGFDQHRHSAIEWRLCGCRIGILIGCRHRMITPEQSNTAAGWRSCFSPQPIARS